MPLIKTIEGTPERVVRALKGRNDIARQRAILSHELGGRVLEIGCGWGYVSALIASARPVSPIVGIDLSDRYARRSRELAALNDIDTFRVLQGSGVALPILDETFDWVVASEVLEHTHDPLAIIRECGRVLLPGGQLLLTVPSHGALPPGGPVAGHVQDFRVQDIHSLISQAGLRLKDHRTVAIFELHLAEKEAQAPGFPVGKRPASSGRNNLEVGETPALLGCYRHGYVGTRTQATQDLDLLSLWRAVSIGEWSFWLHPEARFAASSRPEASVLFVGEIIDLAEIDASAERIAQVVVDTVARNGIHEAIRKVAYLGGRFACFIWTDDRMFAIPDTHAAGPVYWTDDAVASHAHLLAECRGLSVDESVARLMTEARSVREKGVLYYPALLTPFLGVRPLIPNHLLEFDHQGSVHQERFYPFANMQLEADGEKAYRAFADQISKHTTRLCGYGQIGISLTAGWDSRTILAAARPHFDEESFCYTYRPVDNPPPSVDKDVQIAKSLALSLSLPHRIVPVGDVDSGSAFRRIYDRTMAKTRQFAALAQALSRELPDGFTGLMGFGAETGTVFYRNRAADDPTPQELARLYHRDAVGRLPGVIEAFSAFIDETEFTSPRLHPFDFRDVFYWENRFPRWITIRMQEADLSHRVLLPFNQRAIIEAMLSMSYEDRIGKTLQRRFVDAYL